MDILFPGRFSILTKIHECIIRNILNRYAREGKLYIGLRLIVDENWTNYDNPFTFYERKEMFNIIFGKEIACRKICVVPLKYGLNIRKDMKKFCGKIIPIYTREKIWAWGGKFLGVPTIYEKRDGFSATDIKEKIYEILKNQDKLPDYINEIDIEILNFMNDKERICTMKDFANHPNEDRGKFGLKKWLKTLMEGKPQT